MDIEPQVPRFGGFRKLKSFRAAQLVYDLTVEFCEANTGSRSRMHDQMLRAACAAVQRIAEGSQTGERSKKTELKLTGMARASLEELRQDYEDFLKQRDVPVWDADDPRRAELVALRPHTVDEVVVWAADNCGPVQTAPATEPGLPTPTTSLEALANCTLAVISMAVALLDRQLKGQTITLRREESASRRDSVEQLPTEWDG